MLVISAQNLLISFHLTQVKSVLSMTDCSTFSISHFWVTALTVLQMPPCSLSLLEDTGLLVISWPHLLPQQDSCIEYSSVWSSLPLRQSMALPSPLLDILQRLLSHLLSEVFVYYCILNCTTNICLKSLPTSLFYLQSIYHHLIAHIVYLSICLSPALPIRM